VISLRVQYNHDAETERKILRGTWFVQRSDGTLYPYEEDLAAALDAAFLSAREIEGKLGVQVGERRFVHRAAQDGEFVQLQIDTERTRWVTRRYQPGHLEVRSLPVLDLSKDAGDEGAPGLAAGTDLTPAAPLVVTSAEEVRRITAGRVFYFQKGNGMLQAYSEELCRTLNAAFPPNKVVFRGAGVGVKIDEKRRVYRALEGGFAQVHCESGTVRWVTDTKYEGYLPLRTVTPLIDTLRWDSDSCTDLGSGSDSVTNFPGLARTRSEIAMSPEKIADCRLWWMRHGQWGTRPGSYMIYGCAVQV